MGAPKPLRLSPHTAWVSAREPPWGRGTLVMTPFASLISASSFPPRHDQPEIRPMPLTVAPCAGTSSTTSRAGRSASGALKVAAVIVPAIVLLT